MTRDEMVEAAMKRTKKNTRTVQIVHQNDIVSYFTKPTSHLLSFQEKMFQEQWPYLNSYNFEPNLPRAYKNIFKAWHLIGNQEAKFNTPTFNEGRNKVYLGDQVRKLQRLDQESMIWEEARDKIHMLSPNGKGVTNYGEASVQLIKVLEKNNINIEEEPYIMAPKLITSVLEAMHIFAMDIIITRNIDDKRQTFHVPDDQGDKYYTYDIPTGRK